MKIIENQFHSLFLKYYRYKLRIERFPVIDGLLKIKFPQAVANI